MVLTEFIKTSLHKHLTESLSNTQSKYFSKIGLKTEDVFNMIEYSDSYRDLYPNFSDENEYEEDYYFTSIEDAYDDVNKTLEFFNSFPDTITIYRSIKVKSINDINFNYLGESWSYDKESAINFANNEGLGNVDWNMTLKLNYQFSRGNDNYDENEINVIDSDNIFDIKTEKI